MARKPVYVAAHEIAGGTKEKDKPFTPYTVAAGTEITAEVRGRLGLSDTDFEDKLRDGAIVEESVFEPSPALPAGQTAPGTTGTEFEGMSIDDMRKHLDDAGLKYPKGASAPDLMKIALEHQHPSNIVVSSAEIEKMDAKDIRTELTSLNVPFETDANKPALVRALALARAARARG